MNQRDPKAPLSERIAALRGKVTSAKEVRVTIGEAQKVVATREDVKLFFEAVAKGDSIAIYHRSREIPRRDAVQEWLTLPWDEWLKRLRSLAESGDSIAQESVEVYETFADNQLLLSQLQSVLDRFERPCRPIRTKGEVIVFLETLVAEGLAEKSQERPRRKAIHWDDTWYTPKRGVLIANLGWLFVVMATIRAQRRESAERELLERLQPLLDLATLPSDPEDQGLTRLLKGEYEVVAIWESHFRWSGQDQGLFALALERNHRGYCLIVKGCMADFQFPETMMEQEYELPLLVVEEKPDRTFEARFGKLPRLEKEEFQALRQVERLIHLRLNAENQAATKVEYEVEPAT